MKTAEEARFEIKRNSGYALAISEAKMELTRTVDIAIMHQKHSCTFARLGPDKPYSGANWRDWPVDEAWLKDMKVTRPRFVLDDEGIRKCIYFDIQKDMIEYVTALGYTLRYAPLQTHKKKLTGIDW